MLDKIKKEDDLTIDYIKTILNAVHLEEPNSHTLYSNIFDLHNGKVYFYYWHQYDEVVILNVAEEIAKGKIKVKLKKSCDLKVALGAQPLKRAVLHE
ncbi:MAG: hypothetical protein P8078_03810 [bacterium]